MTTGLVLTTAAVLTFTHVTDIPPQAYQYFSVVKHEVSVYLPEVKQTSYFAALIEHESCISLTHSKCWNPASSLKTSREEGAGLGQITRAYNTNGSIRFDLLTEMRLRHADLKELSWSNVYQRPDLQIRSMVLLSKTNYSRLSVVSNQADRMAMMDAAYNGGVGGVLNERVACGLAKGCNPNVWFGNVEKYCLKSKAILYGNRSACDINRHHVYDVMQLRLPKYRKAFNEE
jgi:hypothetical protein